MTSPGSLATLAVLASASSRPIIKYCVAVVDVQSTVVVPVESRYWFMKRGQLAELALAIWESCVNPDPGVIVKVLTSAKYPNTALFELGVPGSVTDGCDELATVRDVLCTTGAVVLAPVIQAAWAMQPENAVVAPVTVKV